MSVVGVWESEERVVCTSPANSADQVRFDLSPSPDVGFKGDLVSLLIKQRKGMGYEGNGVGMREGEWG